MKQKTKFTIALVFGMAAAFTAGLFTETPKTTGLPYADVSRAKTFTKSVVEVDVDAVQEQLGIWEHTNNKKLQVFNEEKLQISEKEKFQTTNEEKLNIEL